MKVAWVVHPRVPQKGAARNDNRERKDIRRWWSQKSVQKECMKPTLVLEPIQGLAKQGLE